MHKLSILSHRVHYIVPAVLFIFSFLLLLIPPFFNLRYSTPLVSHPIIDLSDTLQYFIAGIVFLIALIVLIRPKMPKLSKWAVYSQKHIDTYPSNNQEHNDTQVSFACLIVPFLDSDVDIQKRFIDAASHLVSNKIRSFEIIYADQTFHFHFTSESKQDLDHMISIYKQFFPQMQFDYDCDVSIPDKKLMTSYVTTKNHHPFVLLDLKQVGKLIGPLLASLRQTDFAWIQIIWTEFSSHRLNDLHSNINDKVVDIETPREKEIDGKIEKFDHPAKYSEFHTYSRRLLSHLVSKSGSRLCVVFVRCAVSSQTEMPFSQIEDADDVKMMHLPFHQISTQQGEGKVGERLQVVWTKSNRLLDDMLNRRIDLNECDRMVADFVKNYLRDRYLWSLPFLLMTPAELALLVHLPPASLSSDFNFRTTRGSFVPRPKGEVKKGIAVSQ
jgi:hypothetical protein